MHPIPRAEVIGSMLRPGHLKAARAEHASGALTAHELKRIEDTAIAEVIALQERAGLDVVSDGELRRSTFLGPLTGVVTGSSASIEYDDLARERGFEPLADVPKDKRVVLGLVSTKVAALESAEDLLAKIDAAAMYFPHEQMALSRQCGFASVLDGHPVAHEVQEQKFRLVAAVAEQVWG